MEADAPIKLLPVPESPWDRALYALIIVVLPIGCFSLSHLLKPEWQSGQFSDYVVLMLLPDVAKFFYPFLLYSVFCMVLLLIAPQRFAQRFVIRLGIYTGVLLAFQYVIAVAGTGFLIMSAVSTGVLLAGKWIFGRMGAKQIKIFISVLVFFALGVFGAAIWLRVWPFHAPFFLAVIAVLSAAPFLCLAIAGATAVKLIKVYEPKFPPSLWQGTALLAWLAAYVAAWRFSVLQAMEVYHSLPTSPPDCYIATASARGHRHVVRSWPVATFSELMWVTKQLQVLKCAELALMALAPRLHRILRAVYDVVGVTLAKRLANPFLADLAYLALKPFEWAAALVLKTVVPEIDEYARRLYSNPD